MALKQKKIAIIGYGSQGNAQALNLRDGGYNVIVGLRPKSPHRREAQQAGLKVVSIDKAVQQADLIMMLLSDMAQPKVYKKYIEPYLTEGKVLGFAHGFNILYKTILPPKNIDVFLVSPKGGPGPMVRKVYLEGGGVPMVYAIHQNVSGKAEVLAKEYAAAIGCPKNLLVKTTFKEETEINLFCEQAVLCGGLTRLIMKSFETLVAKKYHPEIAYFECLHEVKLITDLIFEKGIQGMRAKISDTAQWGDYAVGDQVIDEHVAKNMQKVLQNVRSGKFAREWISEYETGLKKFARLRKEAEAHPLEKVGKKVRKRIFDEKKIVR